MKRAVSEAEVEAHLVELCKQHGIWPLKSEALYVGFPDRMLLSPDGRVAFVELKRLHGSMRRAQEIVRGILRGRGFTAVKLESKEEVDDFITGWLGRQ